MASADPRRLRCHPVAAEVRQRENDDRALTAHRLEAGVHVVDPKSKDADCSTTPGCETGVESDGGGMLAARGGCRR
jgi:hypothetical protein